MAKVNFIVSIENYDEYEDKYLLNSPRSLEACKREGILPEELVKQPPEALSDVKSPLKVKQMRYKFFEDKRKELIKIVKKERDRIIRLLEEGNSAGQKFAMLQRDLLAMELSQNYSHTASDVASLPSQIISPRKKSQHARDKVLSSQLHQKTDSHQATNPDGGGSGGGIDINTDFEVSPIRMNQATGLSSSQNGHTLTTATTMANLNNNHKMMMMHSGMASTTSLEMFKPSQKSQQQQQQKQFHSTAMHSQTPSMGGGVNAMKHFIKQEEDTTTAITTTLPKGLSHHQKNGTASSNLIGVKHQLQLQNPYHTKQNSISNLRAASQAKNQNYFSSSLQSQQQNTGNSVITMGNINLLSTVGAGSAKNYGAEGADGGLNSGGGYLSTRVINQRQKEAIKKRVAKQFEIIKKAEELEDREQMHAVKQLLMREKERKDSKERMEQQIANFKEEFRNKQDKLRQEKDRYINNLIEDIQRRQQEQKKLEEIRHQKIMNVKHKNSQLTQFLVNYEIKQNEILEKKQQKLERLFNTQRQKQAAVEHYMYKRKVDIQVNRREKEHKQREAIHQLLQKHEDKRLQVEHKMEQIYLKQSGRTLPASERHQQLQGIEKQEKLKLAQDMAEQLREERLQKIKDKLAQKEQLFEQQQRELEYKIILSQEQHALKVKNKEINKQRKNRKEDYQKQLYTQKLQEDDKKYQSYKVMKAKELEKRIKRQVNEEIEKHIIQEAIQDVFVKNKYDMNALEERIKEMQGGLDRSSLQNSPRNTTKHHHHRRAQSQQKINISKESLNWMIDTEPKHSSHHITFGDTKYEIPKQCSECQRDVTKEKVFLCIFCEQQQPKSFCERCGGPSNQVVQHEHPLLSLIQDFDKYQELTINPSNCKLNEIDNTQEWDKQCYSCNKLVKNGPMFMSAQLQPQIFICYECEFRRPLDQLPNGLSDAVYVKLACKDHLIVNSALTHR